MSRTSQALAVAVLLACTALLVLRRRQAVAGVRAFLSAGASPLTLAVFRIAVFAVLLRLARHLWPVAIGQAALPREALVPPWGLRRVLAVTPFSPGLARFAGIVLVVAAVLGLLGLFARTAAGVSVVAGAYFLGIPGFFGKVDHAHHVLWFAAILAVSPCADVLSVDAVRRAWRRADTGDVAPPAPSRAYGLPVRLVWLLVGTLYFFPGFWKYRSAGLTWIFSDNLRNIAFSKWAELDVLPWFAGFVEGNVRLTQLAALAAVTFELGFVVALFWRRARWAAVAAGLGFHLANRYVLHIDFWPLYWLYVVFLPWDGVLGWVGRRLFRADAVAVYDDGCGICRRTVATLATVDLLGRVSWVPAPAADVGVAHGELLADLHYVSGGRTWRGFDAYRALAPRYPLLWPAVPFLWLPPVAALGRRVYRHVADSRACAVAPLPVPGGAVLTPVRPRAVLAVWAAIAVPAVVLGFAGVEQAWPVAAYPAFKGYRDATLARLDASVRDGSAESPLDLREATGYAPQAWTALSRRVQRAGDPAAREAEALAVFAAAAGRRPDLRRRTVVIRLSVVSTLPSRRGAAPLSSVVVAVVPPSA